MLQLMKYRLLSILRDRTGIFWSQFFPLILCTLFYVTFGDIDDSLECINVAVVVEDESEGAMLFLDFLEAVESTEEDFIALEKMTEEKAKKALRDGEIFGVYYVADEPRLLVAKAEIEESVLQALLQNYQSNLEIIQTVSKEKAENLPKLIERINNSAVEEVYVKEASLGGEETDGMIQYFFSLIAMTCMFGSFLGLDAAGRLQANVGPLGARRCVSGTSKIKLMLSDFLMILLVGFAAVLLLVCYMVSGLKLYLGDEIGKILGISFMGCLIGISMGVLIGSIGRWSERIKFAVSIVVSLGSSFLSGLMVGGIKGLLEEYCPIVNRINPSSIISDAFYSISIYPDSARYTRDILLLAAWAAFLLGGSLFMVRRVRYDSI